MFWLLICIVSKVLKRYYNRSLKFNNRNENNNRPLFNNTVYGLKEDLILLKLSLQEFYPKIYNKFLEVGIALEFYFGNCFLNMFSNYLNNEVIFRIWDLLFFEAFKEEVKFITFKIQIIIFFFNIFFSKIVRS